MLTPLALLFFLHNLSSFFPSPRASVAVSPPARYYNVDS
jgi:hypothetical protein